MGKLVQRNSTNALAELLETFRIVIVGGARQVGKTTLTKKLLGLPESSWITFDDETVLQRVAADPLGYVKDLPKPAIIDEFQRAGSSFLLAVKQEADNNSARGQLLLTGSTNYLATKQPTDTLAGRAGRMTLWPLSMGERQGILETFLDRAFDLDSWPTHVATYDKADLVDAILLGGYPEVVTQELTGRRSHRWFDAYVHDVVSRESLRPMAEIRMESELRLLLSLLAARTGQEHVATELAADSGLHRDTVANYATLLGALNLVTFLPAWSTNLTTKAKQRPKVILTDTGLASDLNNLGRGAFSATADGVSAGAMFETFVVNEILKQTTWSDRFVDVSYYRDRHGAEVDVILEDRRSREVVGLEIKFTSTPLTRHAKHLAMMRDKLGDRFVQGFVVHTGRNVMSLGERIWAIPVAALWQ